MTTKEPTVTQETAEQLGLLPEEFEKIKYILGRTPNFTELSIYSVMWSEHCSYKNSIHWLKQLPRKGGLVIACIGPLLYYFDKFVRSGPTISDSLVIVTCALLLLIIRDYFLLIMIPALIGYWLIVRWPGRSFIKFSCVHLIFWAAVLVFGQSYFLQRLSDRQAAFRILDGELDIDSTPLDPTFTSLIHHIPRAVSNTLLRPYLFEARSNTKLILSLESTAVLLIIIITLFSLRQRLRIHPIFLLSLFLSISVLIFTGLLVSNFGALSRYKAVVLPFLILPFLLQWRRQLGSE